MSTPPSLVTSCEALLAPRIEHRIVPGLERIRGALAALGHPERAFPSALIVGTNGKGSTAALLASVLRSHDLRVGLYTSPHLVDVGERIVVDDRPIPPAGLLARLEALARFPELSYFETMTAAAFLEFSARHVDIAVLEAGMGGRWDATNAGPPTVSLLTNVGTDHRQWLGPTRAAIAGEKGAAMRGRAAIVGAWDDEVEPAIRNAADPATPLTVAADWASVTPLDAAQAPGGRPTGAAESSASGVITNRATLAPVGFSVGGVSGFAGLPLLGAHQLANLRLALAGAAALAREGVIPPLDAARVARGIASTRWPGRLEWLNVDGRALLLDGGHNREAVAAVAATLDAARLSGRIDLLFSCLDDKPLEAMAALLAPRVCSVVVAPVASPRATPAEALAAAFPGARIAPDVGTALGLLSSARPTLVAGSLRLVGEVLRLAEAGRG